MGFMDGLRLLRDRITGTTERKIRTQMVKESESLVDYLMDQFGWDAAGTPSRQSVKAVSNCIARNLRKFEDDAYVKRSVNLHTDFTFGRGIDVPKCKSEQIQDEIINPFWYSAVNQRNFFGFIAQQRRHKETYISGEINILVKIDPDTSLLKLYPINPQEIIEVITDPDEPTRPAFYLLRRNKRVWDFRLNEWSQSADDGRVLHRALRYKIMEATDPELAQGLIYHIGLNEFFDSKRGQSDISTVYNAAESARNMADDGAALSSANAETAYKTKILKGGKTVKDSLMTYFRTRTDGSNPAGAPASEWIENDAMSRDWVQQRDTGAAYREKDMRAQKLIVFAGGGFGEHYMGDPSSGNLATATAMELPVLKMIQSEQKFWASIYSDLIDFQIDIAVVSGKLAGEVTDPDELEVETDEDRMFAQSFPPILQKQILEFMNALGVAVDKTLIPEQTAARLAMENFEVEEIDEKLDELFNSKEIDDALAKMRAADASQIPGMPPGMPPMQTMPQPSPAGGNGGNNGKGAMQ
jgi:hypothetical protein